MKLGGIQYFIDMDIERFLYLKSVFAITNCSVNNDAYCGTQRFRGEFEGFGIYSKEFPKGKYTL